jgi:DNA-binding response OmpR family regulator
MNILIVDDHPTIRRVATVAFQMLGCRPYAVSTVGEARRVLSDRKIDAIFLDVNLGTESGMEFLAELGTHRLSPPVVMFTALDTSEVSLEAARLGAIDCVGKPFTLDRIRQSLDRVEIFWGRLNPREETS